MSTKIYTKTGDQGNTSLIGGTKVPKSDARIDAYGTVDELNSHIGLVSDLLGHDLPEAAILLRDVQDRLFTIGSSLACDPHKAPQLKIPDLHAADVTSLEKAIDVMNDSMPPMTTFILPVGHPAVSTTHIARCVCRRAERCCVLLKEQQAFVEPLVLQYLNRLSDYLFVLARYAAHIWNIPDIPWKPRLSR